MMKMNKETRVIVSICIFVIAVFVSISIFDINERMLEQVYDPYSNQTVMQQMAAFLHGISAMLKYFTITLILFFSVGIAAYLVK